VIITVLETGLTDATLKLSFGDTAQIHIVTVNRNNSQWLSASIAAMETVVVDPGVLPARTYTYQAFVKRGTDVTGMSRAVQARTMDTTSHNAVWQIDTLGYGSGSTCYDVAILNDTLVYAVGEFYLKDSTGQVDPQQYGLAVWNGKQWQLKKVAYHDWGSTSLYPGPLFSVFAFGPNDVYAGAYANLLHWDGQNWTEKAFFMTSDPFTGQITKIWGASTSDLYCGGRNGAIYHVTGSTWQKIESGTTIDFRDIYGSTNGSTTEILALASTGLAYPSAKKLVQITGNSVNPVNDDGMSTSLYGLWFVAGKEYFTVGDGVFRTTSLGDTWTTDVRQPVYYVFGVRGLERNDILMTGAYGYISHFNGSTSKLYTNNELPSFTGNFYAAAISSKLFVIVGGIDGRRATAIVGKRMP
jgi:hypothetical protein